MAWSIWEKEAFLSQEYDLIIVGAGIVGLSSAYFLKIKFPELNILVLERGYLPNGASTKNAGFACFGSPTELLSDLEMESEQQVINRIKWRWDGLQRLRSTLGDQTLRFEACGGYELFTDDEDFEKVRANLDRLNDLMQQATGVNHHFEEKRLNGKKAVQMPHEGAIHSGWMMKSWIQKVQSVGVEIRFNTTVTKVKPFYVQLENQIELHTKRVLVATNGFASELIKEKIHPARGLVLISKPLSDLKWRGIFHYDEGFIYFRNVGNRLLLGGGRNQDFEGEETNEMGENPIIHSYLCNFSEKVLGIRLNEELDYAWSGIMGFSGSKSPLMLDEDGYSVRAGLGGMGVALGSDIGFRFAENWENVTKV